MGMSRQEKIELSRKHAFAVLQDKGKLLPTAVLARVKSVTMLALLGVTYEDGVTVTAGGAENALLHWHNTGFMVYAGNPKVQANKKRAIKDARLIKTAIAETRKNQREAVPFFTKGEK